MSAVLIVGVAGGAACRRRAREVVGDLLPYGRRLQLEVGDGLLFRAEQYEPAEREHEHPQTAADDQAVLRRLRSRLHVLLHDSLPVVVVSAGGWTTGGAPAPVAPLMPELI